MGTFGQGVSELGDPKVKKYFQNFPMLFQARNKISRFFMTKHASCTNGWTDFDEPYLIRREIERPRKRLFSGCILGRGFRVFPEKRIPLSVRHSRLL